MSILSTLIYHRLFISIVKVDVTSFRYNKHLQCMISYNTATKQANILLYRMIDPLLLLDSVFNSLVTRKKAFSSTPQ